MLIKNIPTLSALVLLALPACVAADSLAKPSSLPLEIARSSTVSSARSFVTRDRLYIAGRAASNPRAHVDVKLLGPGDRVIAEACESLAPTSHPRTAAARAGTTAYVASFPRSESRSATRVRVTVHQGPRCHS